MTLSRLRAILWTAILAVLVIGIATYVFVSLASSPTPDLQSGRTYEVHWKQYGVSYLTADEGRVLDGISVILMLTIVVVVPALFILGGIERVRAGRAETDAARPRTDRRRR